MSKKHFNFAAGWVKQTTNGDSYISCKANNEANDKGNVTIHARDADGNEVPIQNFAVFYNTKEKDTHPDVRFVFTVEE